MNKQTEAKIYSLLGLAMRAGKVVSGDDTTLTELKKGYVKLVIIADDASNNTKKLFKDKSSFRSIQYIHFSTKLQLGLAIGKAPRAVLGIKDNGFAKKLEALMEEPKNIIGGDLVSKTRVYQIAEELKISNEDVLAKLKELEINVSDKDSELEEDEVELALEILKDEIAASKGNTISVNGKLTVQELANSLDKSASEIIMKLIKMGTMATINQEISFEIASLVASEYGFELVEGSASDEDELEAIDTLMDIEEDKEEDLVKRPPVVTVMGHVDHGKTSLLDAIRKTNVTSSEAGGITQHIGASEVMVNGEKVVFLDTPGHEAFTSMRARGAQVTDMAILVVAADDGIMPQTVEAINHAKAAEVPLIVAINKIDKPGANPDRVKQELADQGLLVEDWGGDVISVPVSALKREGIDTLLEMVLLVAEMEELKANPKKRAVGTVIEAQLDKGRGPVATVLVQGGTLKVGDPIVAGVASGKVRAMINSKGKRVKTAGPSTAVEILGLSEVPQGGDQVVAVPNDKAARMVAEKRQQMAREEMLKSNQRMSLDDFFSQMGDADVKELPIVVKADVQGSVQAVKQSLEKLSNEEVAVRVIHGGVGAVTESDIMLATASNAIIIGFNVRPVPSAEVLAKKEGVDIRTYTIIYKAIEDVQAAMVGMLDPEYRDEDTGKAEVRETFKLSGVGTIAGCYVTSGKVFRGSKVRIVRDGFIIHEGQLAALKRFKDDVKEVNYGYECGMSFVNYNDVKEGDIIEAYITKEVERKL